MFTRKKIAVVAMLTLLISQQSILTSLPIVEATLNVALPAAQASADDFKKESAEPKYGKTWLSTITCEDASGNRRTFGQHAENLAQLVSNEITSKGYSYTLPAPHAILRSTDASGGGNVWTNEGTIHMQTVRAVCAIFGYQTYVSSTCLDTERSSNYPNGKCNYHSAGNNYLYRFDGEVLFECNDGIDNDGDGKKDLADAGCTNAMDDSEDSDVGQVVTIAPEGDIRDTTPTYRWNSLPGVDDYELWVSLRSSPNVPLIDLFTSSTSLTPNYTLTPGENYSFWVRARKNGQNGIWSQVKHFRVTDGAPECSDGRDNDNDGKIDALQNVTTNGSIRWTDCAYIRDFVNSFPEYNNIPETAHNLGCADDDATTRQKICELAGYSRVTNYTTGRWHSCSDNTIGYWDESIDNFTIANACSVGNSFLTTLSCDTPLSQCNDGIDNDGDGRIDSADNGCASSQDNDEREHDPQCTDPTDDTEGPDVFECNDGIDNDGDTLVDYPNDPGCDSATDNDESPQNDVSDVYVVLRGPSSVVRGQTITYEPTIKNRGPADADLVTMKLSIPNGLQYNAVASDSACGQQGNEIICSGFGLTRLEQKTMDIVFQTTSSTICQSTLSATATVSSTSIEKTPADNTSTLQTQVLCTACSDGIDNDGDGRIDSQDPGCTSPTDDDERERNGPQCDNGIDDDRDGKTDYPADPDCDSPTDNTEAHTPTQCGGYTINSVIGSRKAPFILQSLPPFFFSLDLDEAEPPVLVAQNLEAGQQVTINASGYITFYGSERQGPEGKNPNNSNINWQVVHALVGQWTDQNNNVVGDPVFYVGRNFTGTVPAGASRLYLAAGDNDYGDNGGSWSVTGTVSSSCECEDGIDNDGDGAVDYPEDFSCSSPTDDDETNPKSQCQDGIDNDGDGYTDTQDPGCEDNQDNSERDPNGPQCDNGIDDDRDGKTDYPADPDCDSPTDDDEGSDNSDMRLTVIPRQSEASKGTDVRYYYSATNNGPGDAHDVVVSLPIPNGFTYKDFISDGVCEQVGNAVECPIGTIPDNQTRNLTIGFTVGTSANCTNDVTFTGRVDSSTPDSNLNNNVAIATLDVLCEQCSDGIDNDGDGAVDYPEDFSCSSPTDNDETNPKAECQDGIDNDGDGRIDTADLGCEDNQDNSEDSDLAKVVTISPNGTITDTTPTYVWNSVPNAVDYELWVSERATPSIALIREYTSNTSLTPSFQLTPGKQYSFWVRARNGATLGPWSTVRHFDVEVVVLPECSDGIDNDGDGAVDYPEDFSCSSPTDDDETNPKSQCQDGIDNDGDGYTDTQDPGCEDNQDNSERDPNGPQCDNGIDDDGDGRTDYPADNGCTGPTDDDETDVLTADLLVQKFGPSTVVQGETVIYTVHTTNLGPNTANNVTVSDVAPAGLAFNRNISSSNCVLNGNSVSCDNVTLQAGESYTFQIGFNVTSATTCNGTIRNVATVSTSSTDPNPNNNTSQTVTSSVQCNLPECSDGIDNDGDGAVDYPEDFSCSSPTDDDETNPKSQCQDGIDNDGDGYTDTQDPGCEDNQDNSERDPNGPQCDNGIDDDNDGETDYPADNGCTGPTDDDETDPQVTANLGVTKIGPSVITQGSTVTYNVYVQNFGPGTANSVVASDVVPAGLQFNRTLSDARCSLQNNTVQCSLANLPAFNSDGFSIVFTVTNATTCNGTVRNTATVTSSTLDPDTSNNTSVTISSTVQCPLPECSDGIDNDGDGAVDYPADFACSSPTDDDEGDVLAACQDRVDNDGDGLVDFPQDPGCDSLQDNDETNAPQPTDVSINLYGPASVRKSESIPYSVVVANLGPNALASSAAFTVSVPTGYAFDTSASDTACVSSSTTVTCNTHLLGVSNSQSFSVVLRPLSTNQCGVNISNQAIITNVPQGDTNSSNNQSAIVQTSVTCSACSDGIDNDGDGAVDYPEDYSCSSPDDNDEQYPLAQCQDGIDNDGDGDADYPEDPGCDSLQDDDEFNQVQHDLFITKSGPIKTAPGRTIVYTLTATNLGPQTATNVHILDVIPTGLTFDPTNSSSNCVVNGGNVICNNFSLQNQESRTVNVAFTVSTGITCGSNIRNVGIVNTSATDLNPDDNRMEISTEVECNQNANLSISKTDNRTTAAPGEVLDYTITITNSSGVDATGVDVSDNLPSGLDYVSATYGPSVQTQGNAVVVLWSGLTVPANSRIILSLSGQIKSTVQEGTVLQNKVQINGGVSATDNTTVSTQTQFGCVEIYKVAQYYNGGTVSPVPAFTFRVSGTGLSTTNDTNGYARLVNVPVGQQTIIEDALHGWEQTSVVPTGGVVTVTTGSQCAQVTFTNRESFGSQQPSFSIAKTDNVGTILPNQSLTYTITVQNTSSVPASYVRVVDILPPELTFVSANNNGVLQNGEVVWDNFTLNPGDVITLQIQTVVRANVAAGTVIFNIAQVIGNNGSSQNFAASSTATYPVTALDTTTVSAQVSSSSSSSSSSYSYSSSSSSYSSSYSSYSSLSSSAEYEDDVIVNEIEFEEVINPFTDTDMNTLEGQAAADLFYKNVIGGFSDGTFRGFRFTNRAEIAKFILLAKDGTVPNVANNGQFSDVKDGEWYVKYVVTAALQNIVNGYSNGTFGPGNPVNTAEFLKMITLAFGLEQNLSYNYTDVQAGSWYEPYAGVAEKYNLFPNRTTQLTPSSALSRKDVAIAIYQLLKNK